MSENNEATTVSKHGFAIVRGLPVPGGIFLRENIESAMDYKPKDGDVILCSYPKTGTTWVQYIVWQILTKGESYPSMDDLTYNKVPFMELVNSSIYEQLQPPRMMKNHLPYHHNNINPNAKYMYVHRNPRDTLTSYFYFYNERTKPRPPVEFDWFFERFINGELPYGDYFDHVLEFNKHKDDGNVLMISYERLKNDIESEILRIAKFLDGECHRTLVADKGLLQKIVKMTSFDYMKANLVVKIRSEDKSNNADPVIFFRKGIVGDGKLHVSGPQDKALMDKVEKKMVGTDLFDEWRL